MRSLKLTIHDIALLFCMSVICFLFFNKGCDKPDSPSVVDREKDSLKVVIANQYAERDSLIQLSGNSGKLRDSIITRWRTIIKPITLTEPCDSVLPIVVNACDSIITADSLHISDLKKIIVADSGIKANQRKIMVKDSSKIVELSGEVASLNNKNSSLRKQRNVVAGVGLVGWLVAVFK